MGEHFSACQRLAYADNIHVELVTPYTALCVPPLLYLLKTKNEKASDVAKKKHKLECLMTFQLAGQVVSLQPVKLAGFSRDALLLSFQQVKVCCFCYLYQKIFL